MTKPTDPLPTLDAADLDQVNGGINFAGIAQSIGGIVDSFTGGTKGREIGGSIAGLIQAFGGGGGGGGEGA